MNDRCHECGANTKNIGCHAYSSRSSYPSGSDHGGGRSSGSSSRSGFSGNNGFSGYSDNNLIEQKSVIIKQPDAVIAVLGNEINLNSVGGWYNPTDYEIAKGMNPHFKVVSGDSEMCIAGKMLFNQSINDALNSSSVVGAVGLVAEVMRIKTDLERSKTQIRQNCKSKFNGSFRIDPKDFDKYL